MTPISVTLIGTLESPLTAMKNPIKEISWVCEIRSERRLICWHTGQPGKKHWHEQLLQICSCGWSRLTSLRHLKIHQGCMHCLKEVRPRPCIDHYLLMMIKATNSSTTSEMEPNMAQTPRPSQCFWIHSTLPTLDSPWFFPCADNHDKPGQKLLSRLISSISQKRAHYSMATFGSMNNGKLHSRVTTSHSCLFGQPSRSISIVKGKHPDQRFHINHTPSLSRARGSGTMQAWKILTAAARNHQWQGLVSIETWQGQTELLCLQFGMFPL